MYSLSVSPTPVLISRSSKNIPNPNRSSVSTLQNNLQYYSIQDSRKKASRDEEEAFHASSSHHNQVHASVYSTSTIQNARSKEHISLLALSPPPRPSAGPRNLSLNSAQPSLGRLHFYIIPNTAQACQMDAPWQALSNGIWVCHGLCNNQCTRGQ